MTNTFFIALDATETIYVDKKEYTEIFSEVDRQKTKKRLKFFYEVVFKICTNCESSRNGKVTTFGAAEPPSATTLPQPPLP